MEQINFGLRKTAVVCCFLLILIFNSSAVAESICEVLQPWLNLPVSLVDDPSENTQKNLESYNIAEGISIEIYNKYMSGTLPKKLYEICIPDNVKREELLAISSRVFYELSLRKLKNANIPELTEILSKIEEKQKESLVIFRATDHQPKGVAYRAGFFRSTKSLFLDFEDISPDEWLFWLVHEMIHTVDPVLARASLTFNQPETVKSVFSRFEKADSLLSASADDISYLRADLQEGLNLGLLGEYRAFSKGISLYKEGRAKGLWVQITWIEDLLSQKPANKSIESVVFKFLDPKFSDPNKEGIFSLNPVFEEYVLMRQELRDQPR